MFAGRSCVVVEVVVVVEVEVVEVVAAAMRTAVTTIKAVARRTREDIVVRSRRRNFTSTR